MDLLSFSRVNIGCGYTRIPGYLNVDMDPACRPDVLLQGKDLDALPQRHFDELLAHDVLEHIPRAETASVLLRWAALLKVGGRLDLKTSNVEGIAQLLLRDRSFERHDTYTTFMYGNQRHPGDWHYTGFTDITLRTHLICAGFTIDSFDECGEWLFRVQATRTEDWTALLDRPLSDEAFVGAATQAALFRRPQQEWWQLHLEAARRSRRELLEQFWSSPERALRVAQRNGF